MANDPHDNEADDRAMLRKLRDQETIMSNDDERDYAEEQYNAHLLDDETDPDEDYDTSSLAKEDARNAWQHESEDNDPRPVTRNVLRAEALRLTGIAERSDPEFATALGLGALTRAVLALSAPASPEPDSTWRQRAVEAEAALTAIGGICARSSLDNPPDPPAQVLARIEHVLRVSGQQADRIITRYRPDEPEPALTPADVDALILTAGELADAYGTGDDLDPSDILSARQREVLAKARDIFRERGADPGDLS